MKPLDLVHRIAWAAPLCVGGVAGGVDLLISRSSARRGGTSHLYAETLDSLTVTDLEGALATGFTWAAVACVLSVMLYYAAKYVLTGRMSNPPGTPASPATAPGEGKGPH